jgi:hypothetical protein
MPRFSLQGNEGGALEGIPAELRGTQGAWGMGVLAGSAMTVRALGGAGGAGGAGLMLVLRGALSFGVSGTINLSGANGAAPGSSVSVGGKLLVAGGGGGGAPGCLLIALDRRNLTYPDLTNKFIANHGSTTQSGSPIMRAPPDNPAEPWTGSSPGISTASHFGACHQIQYLPIRFSPLGEGSTEVVPVPTIVAVTGNDYGIEVQIESIPEAEYDVVEVWGSADNNRANATKLATGRGTQLRVPLSALQTFYLWLRARHGARRSEWSSAADDGYQTSGGPPVLWVDYWVDHFESYETLEDFEKEWEFQQTPTSLSFPRVGINGGKVLQVVGPMRARYRRNIPYNRNALYECEARVRRTVASSGNEQMSIGFWGATPDGTIINGAGGITTFVPNRTLLSAFDMGTLTIDSWQRAMNWFTGSTSTTLTFQTQTPFADTLAPWRPFTLKPRADISPEVPLAYVRPSIECNQVAGSAATCQIDYISVRKISNDFAHADIADSSFSSAIDYEFWTAPSFSWDATLAVASETNGGNSLKFDVAGTVANNTIAARHRHVFRLSDTVKLTFRYRFANVSSLGSQVRFGFYLLGVAHSGEMPRRYVDLGGTPPSVDVLCNTLTTGGGLATLSLSLTSMFSNSYLSGADYIRPVVYVSLPESSDSFDLHVVRAQLTRT